MGSSLSAHAAFLATPHVGDALAARTLLWPWAIQFVASWVGFSMYAYWDWLAFSRGTLDKEKLPSRHPLSESPLPASESGNDGKLALWRSILPEALCPRVSVFWYTQLFMVPLVLFNQLVVWPLTSLIFVWPAWASRHATWEAWSAASLGGGPGVFACLVGLILVSDQMWYWGHRSMHLPWAWKNLHKMHHIAPQCAISATYVHPIEYAIFTVCIQLPAALVGFPVLQFLIPMAWGMLTGGGAHSGYGGDIANGEKHGTGHHLYHSANFGLLMVADAMYGTHWSPGDPPPAQFKLAQRDIEDRYTTAVGQGAAEVLELARRAREEAEAADAKAAMTKAGSAAARDAPAKENGRRPKKTD